MYPTKLQLSALSFSFRKIAPATILALTLTACGGTEGDLPIITRPHTGPRAPDFVPAPERSGPKAEAQRSIAEPAIIEAEDDASEGDRLDVPSPFPALGGDVGARARFTIGDEFEGVEASTTTPDLAGLEVIASADAKGATWDAEVRRYRIRMVDEASGERLELMLPELETRAYAVDSADADLTFIDASGIAYSGRAPTAHAAIAIAGTSEQVVYGTFSGRLCADADGASGPCRTIALGHFTALIEPLEFGLEIHSHRTRHPHD